MDLDFRLLWHQALPFQEFVRQSTHNCDLWSGTYRLARIPASALAAADRAGTRHRLLVLAEDWCVDGSSTVPYLARLCEATAGLELRILRRDEHPEVMDRYLTNGSRSIPIVIVLDRDYQELGHWGPRPAELQRWLHEARGTVPKGEIPMLTRRWYARDKGQSTLREVVALLEPSATSYQPSAV